MAIYPYRCLECGKSEEVVQSISSYSASPQVPVCCFNAGMARVITAPMVSADLQSPYVSPLDGTLICSRQQQREHMVKHGVVHFNEIAPDFERNRIHRAKQAVADIKSDLIDAVHKVDAGHKPQIVPEAELIPTA
jgi:NAD-dependent SIR2 family protein deacetylase